MDHETRAGMLHHVELYVSDLAESAAFWGWLLERLGYREYQRWETGRSWKKGETYIVFVQTPEEHVGEGYHRRRTGINHLAFHAASRDAVDELTQRLRDRGTAILYEDRHPFAGGADHYAVYFEDPNRIKVEVAAPE